MAIELKPDRRVAIHFHTLLSIATALTISVLVILFADAVVRGFVGLVIYVGAYVISVQFALSGVFIDFYLKERHTRWTADDEGIRIRRRDDNDNELETFVAWGDVAWINPRDHRISLAVKDTPHPHLIYFVPPEPRGRLYDLYVSICVYPFMKQDAPEARQPVQPRGVLAHDPLEEQWDPRRMH